MIFLFYSFPIPKFPRQIQNRTHSSKVSEEGKFDLSFSFISFSLSPFSLNPLSLSPPSPSPSGFLGWDYFIPRLKVP